MPQLLEQLDKASINKAIGALQMVFRWMSNQG
jgi:hypothetical protein